MSTSTTGQLTVALAGRYTVERQIGSGAMATVYLARDMKHERMVALKVLKQQLGAVLGAERFLSEIRVTASLLHPNLLPLFDSGETGGLLYYVMPYVEGETLRQLMDREQQLPVSEAVRIAASIASALDYAHREGVVHRDLKPENILMQHGQPLVADFGIALAVTKVGGARITKTGLSLGTPEYMSPEQAAGDRAVDGRTDTYSLAAVTYEMLAGAPPHTGASAQATIAKLMLDEPTPISRMRKGVPPHVEMAVMRGLAKVPDDRFAHACDFADALRGRPSTPVARTEAAPTAGWRTMLLLTAAASVAAAATSWGWNRSHADPASPPHLARAPRHADPSAPRFSPDSQWISWLAAGALMKVPAKGGGSPVRVADSVLAYEWAARDSLVVTRKRE
ncbi:MAG: protein kinase [Gemmatimonadetes bacterium]|nr:protein kinase [Gemmatimonadota bacterium]